MSLMSLRSQRVATMAAQADLLRRLRVQRAQGFLFHRPMPARENDGAQQQRLVGYVQRLPAGMPRVARAVARHAMAGLLEAADILVVKAIPLGGVQRALDLVTEIGLPAVVSGSLDTSVGLSSGIALAASIPHLYGSCGLGTGTLFAEDLVTPTTLPTNGELIVRRASPDAHLLASSAAKVSDSDRLCWQERIVRAWQSGANDLVSPNVKEAVEQ